MCGYYEKMPYVVGGGRAKITLTQLTPTIIHTTIHTHKNEKPTMKLPVAVVLGATITTSAAAFAISRGSSVTRSGSLLSNIRNNYFQRNSMGSTTSARAASVEYAKSEIASNDVSFFYTHTDVVFYVLFINSHHALRL